jgi:hypothetical protein
MTSIYYLNANDFVKEGNNLALNIGGLTFVMFHSQRCGHCTKFLPEFSSLPGSIRGVNFGLCSVDAENAVIAQMANDSSTSIKAVPKFILYSDGMPTVEYSGQRSRQAVLNFLQDVIPTLNRRQDFAAPRRTRQQQPQTPQQPVGAPTRPPGVAGMAGTPSRVESQQAKYKITESTGVKEYETSYGRPYNTTNEAEFLEYESAYKQGMKK